MEIQSDPICLKPIIESVLDIIRFETKEKKLQLDFDYDSNIPEVMYSDEKRLKQILLNLLSNSVKYTFTGYISVRAKFRTPLVNIDIIDTGIGIKDSQKSSLFKLFGRLDDDKNQKKQMNQTGGGAGLGLTISQALCKRIGTGITFSSQSGVGSKFSFTIFTNPPRRRTGSGSPIRFLSPLRSPTSEMRRTPSLRVSNFLGSILTGNLNKASSKYPFQQRAKDRKKKSAKSFLPKLFPCSFPHTAKTSSENLEEFKLEESNISGLSEFSDIDELTKNFISSKSSPRSKLTSIYSTSSLKNSFIDSPQRCFSKSQLLLINGGRSLTYSSPKHSSTALALSNLLNNLPSSSKHVFPEGQNLIPIPTRLHTENPVLKTATSYEILASNRECQCAQILIVDDNSYNLKILKGLLMKLEFSVETAMNGEEAVEKVCAMSACPNSCMKLKAVLMDCQMPLMNGFEATKRILQMVHKGEVVDVPIIACTAYEDSDNKQKCYESGMHHIIHKPVYLKQLKDALALFKVTPDSNELFPKFTT